jgi:hypothetical protein
MFIDAQQMSFIERTIARGRYTYGFGERFEFICAHKLDPDGPFLRMRVASHRQDAQPRASSDLRAEPLNDLC